MTLQAKFQFSQEEIELGLAILTDPIGFALAFWKEDLTIPETRTDLPEHWRGKQVLTREQVIMATAGALPMLLGPDATTIHPQAPFRIAARTSRKTGKTVFGFEMRYVFIAMSAVGGTEGLLHTPGDAHMAPVVNRIDRKIAAEPIFRMMRESLNRDKGIDKWRGPNGGFTWHRRIEGPPALGGRNMVGLRASYILGDEGDYGSKGAFDERQQTALPGCYEFWGGVPREGVNSIFRQVCSQQRGREDAEWMVLAQGNWRAPERWDLRANPIFHSDAAFHEQLGEDPWESPRVQTQILGLDGDQGVSVFGVIPTVDAPWWRIVRHQFNSFTNVDEEIEALASEVSAALDDLTVDATQWIVHVDYGHSPAPMIIGISFLDPNTDNWTELMRFDILRASAVTAAKFIHQIDLALPQRADVIVIDAQGRGAGTFEVLREQPEYQRYGYSERVISPNFHMNIDSDLPVHVRCKSIVSQKPGDFGLFWYCDRCHERLTDADVRMTQIPSKQYWTTRLDNMFYTAAAHQSGTIGKDRWGIVIAAQDRELRDELLGTRALIRPNSARVLYIPRMDGVDHNSDAWRCLACGIQFVEEKAEDQMTDAVLQEMGFFAL